jgi:quinol-cytochrome oxidoreductase complex cytochrome b subunit
MRRMLRDNGLSITMFALFLVFLVAQSVAGYKTNNSENEEHNQPRESYGEYLASGAFVEATFENWESEFLQMGVYVLFTAWLIQKGSPESKKPDGDKVDADPRTQRDTKDAPAPVKRGGPVLTLYEHSLSIALFTLFLLSFVLHALGGHAEFNQQQLEHGEAAVSLWSFVTSSEFWFQSMQNWQSEFLAVGALTVLSIWLRQRGSPESKPVAAPHAQTGSS